MGTNQDGPAPAVDLQYLGVNTDLLPQPVAPPPQEPVKPAARVFTRERASNTDPAPKSPPYAWKMHKWSNTLQTRSIPKGTATELKMVEIISKDGLENKIPFPVLMTEEDIISCWRFQIITQKL